MCDSSSRKSEALFQPLFVIYTQSAHTHMQTKYLYKQNKNESYKEFTEDKKYVHH